MNIKIHVHVHIILYTHTLYVVVYPYYYRHTECTNVYIIHLFGGSSNDGKLSSREIADTGGVKTKATVLADL